MRSTYCLPLLALSAALPAVERCQDRDGGVHAASGAVGHIEGSWAYPRGRFNLRIEIAGSGGIIEWDSRARAPVELALSNGDGKPTASGSSPTAPQDDPYYAELAHFVSCVEANEPFLVSPYDGLMAVKISRAAIESLETGKPVTIG